MKATCSEFADRPSGMILAPGSHPEHCITCCICPKVAVKFSRSRPHPAEIIPIRSSPNPAEFRTELATKATNSGRNRPKFGRGRCVFGAGSLFEPRGHWACEHARQRCLFCTSIGTPHASRRCAFKGRRRQPPVAAVGCGASGQPSTEPTPAAAEASGTPPASPLALSMAQSPDGDRNRTGVGRLPKLTRARPPKLSDARPKCSHTIWGNSAARDLARGSFRIHIVRCVGSRECACQSDHGRCRQRRDALPTSLANVRQRSRRPSHVVQLHALSPPQDDGHRPASPEQVDVLPCGGSKPGVASRVRDGGMVKLGDTITSGRDG